MSTSLLPLKAIFIILTICYLGGITGCSTLNNLVTNTDIKMADKKEGLSEEEIGRLEQQDAPPFTIGKLSRDGYQIVPVLLYHGIVNNTSSRIHITVKKFKRQMNYLKKNGFSVITLDELYDFINLKQPIPERSVVLTFDDGYRSFYENAYPILKKNGFSATLFIYTDFIRKNSRLSVDWDMLKRLDKEGIDIQSHTKSHINDWCWQRKGEQRERFFERVRMELCDARSIIEKRIGNRVRYIAYPYGQFNDDMIRIAKECGYEGGLTLTNAPLRDGRVVTGNGNSFFANPFLIRRAQITRGVSMKGFINRLKCYKEYKTFDDE